MTMRLRPDLCLVKLAPSMDHQRNAAGLIEAAALTPVVCYGRVVQAGAHVERYGITAGDLVLFGPTTGDLLDGMFPTPHLLISALDCLAVIERSQPRAQEAA